MDAVTQYKRFEEAFKNLYSEYNLTKEDLNDLKRQFHELIDENRRLRKELKDSVENQLTPNELNLLASKTTAAVGNKGGGTNLDESRIRNLESQLRLMANERENAVQMWQNSLSIIGKMEEELKTLQFRAAPQTMAFDLEMKQREEEFARNETHLLKEVAIYKAELSKKDEDMNDLKLKMNDLRLQLENLHSQLNQKDLDKRNLIKKEFGYDDALISLQNDINDLETKNQVAQKDNQYLKESNRELSSRVGELSRTIVDLEHKNSDLKAKLSDAIHGTQNIEIEREKIRLIELKHKEENDRLSNIINELMNEAATKTKSEVDSLKAIYNRNIEKLINECSSLESDRTAKENQLEKALRAKRALEQELEKLANESLRNKSQDSLTYEDLHKRLCAVEREKDQAVLRSESREAELLKLRNLYENDKEKNHELLNEFKEKANRASRDLERLNDDYARLLSDNNELKEKLSAAQAERDNLQKNLTKQIQLSESELVLRMSDYQNKLKCVEESQTKAMFDLRQLLNMQQRMSNKWKEECHTITKQSELKFAEMKKNFENLKRHSENLTSELNEMRRKQLENEKETMSYINRIKMLEGRVKDAEIQAAEVTRRASKQFAKERLTQYEKHLIESDLERIKFNDVVNNGNKLFMSNENSAVNANVKQRMAAEKLSASSSERE